MVPGRLNSPRYARTPAKPRVSSEDVGTQQDCRIDRKKTATQPEDATSEVGWISASTAEG